MTLKLRKLEKPTERFFISNPGHIEKIKRRDTVKEFKVWRESFRDLKKSYLILLQSLRMLSLTISKSSKKDQRRVIETFKSSLKAYCLDVYSYQQKTTKFVDKYFSTRDIPPFRKIIDSVNKRMFFTIPLSFFIDLHNCTKHSGALGFLIFDIGKDGIDLYIKNITTKDEDWWIGSCHSGIDLYNLITRSMRYVRDIEDDIFLVMTRMS